MDLVRIGDPHDCLELSPGTRDGSGYPISVVAALVTPGLEARSTVDQSYPTGFDDLVAFFAGLSRDWRGWAGLRSFRSLEGDFTVDATHDGHVWLAVGLSHYKDGHGWEASTTLRLDPGEQLSQVASGLRDTLSRHT